MNRYFNNPEIKKSSMGLIIIMISFLALNLLLIKLHNDKLKEDYIKVFGSITAKVVEVDPELESEIVPLLTKDVTQEQELKGREILRQYGLSNTLDTEVFPYINGNFKSIQLTILYSGIILTFILFIFNYIQYGYFYKTVRAFTSAAKRIVEGDYNLKLSEEREGDLSKLTKSFNSMGEVIRGNIYALNKEKSFLVDLLSDISHQLKTPLSSMILYNDILLNKDLTKEQERTFLKNSENQLNRMKWLILNLLKLAKIDANAIELEIENQSLNETIEETIETLQDRAIQSKVKLEFVQNEQIFLKHDRLWIQEALINLVKNGIEHSGEGGRVYINIIDNPIYTKIIISNTGEAICEEDLPHIFKRFYKGKKSKNSESIGIGLALAKSVVEKHGGYIEVSSKPSEDTSFTISFLKY
ncbi:sensor kinase CusS [Clostridium homopropionicum DSM 5847]|uniref:histidine kinase n=1 Tax=Clostridium homopropionicum DSM 5847 TaxID=1121318 RepID=A0A0L6Z9N3_9CLOT|nr:HAMP domain-containing sensor histidine kinase [Clostridium homopropionicum]KOA19675.1 sensor kinase CusS [Clostridium homopropionicum DSM 5847]SFF80330.1 Signal transduction histidine kinase [Clostridium homopropionicum]